MKTSEYVLAGLAMGASVIALASASLLMGSHMPFRAEIAPGAEQLRPDGEWQAIAILSLGCACSGAVAEHLIARGPMRGIEERIVAVAGPTAPDSSAEPSWPRRLTERGFDVRRRTPLAARTEYGVASAPLLIVLDPGGAVRYSGGWARRPDFRDGFQEGAILANLRGGIPVAALPARGCALGSLLLSVEQYRKPERAK